MTVQETLFGEKPGTPDSPAAIERIVVEGETVTASSPEGATCSMQLVELLKRVHPRVPDTADSVLPDGVKCALPIAGGTVLVKEVRPRVQPVRWIANDSPVPYGPDATYREATIALPYTIIVAVFDARPGRLPVLARSSECFFSNQSLDREGLDTELCYPALLNCSRFPVSPEHPLSWICIEHLPPSDLKDATTPTEAYHKGVTALLEHLYGAAFNLSSDMHELSSWFTETVKAGVDERVSSIEAWEQATREDSLFALEVPWLPTGLSLRAIVERIAGGRGNRMRSFETARDLCRVVFNAAQQETK